MVSSAHKPAAHVGAWPQVTAYKDAQSSCAPRNLDPLPNAGFILSFPLPPDACMKKMPFAVLGT